MTVHQPHFRINRGVRAYLWMLKRESILEDVRAGLPYDQIAASRGVSEQRIGEVARDEGLSRKAPRLTFGVESQIAACLRARDASDEEIATAFNITKRMVATVRERYGLVPALQFLGVPHNSQKGGRDPRNPVNA